MLKNLEEFNCVIGVLGLLKNIGLFEDGKVDYMVTWEKRPQLIINKLGNFEFQNPEEVYGCVITFWDMKDEMVMKEISKSRFNIGEKDE